MPIAPVSIEDFGAIARVPLFSGLTVGQLTELLRGSFVRSFSADTLLFSAGDRADRFFIVLEGAVRLVALNRDGDETIIEVISACSSFAEGALFASGRFPVQAEVLAGARVVAIDGAGFLNALRGNKTLAIAMLSVMGRWQLRLLTELRRLKLQSPAQRLAGYLLALADGATPDARIKLPHRKNLIAKRIGITPESLSRALSRLGDHGVESRGDQLIIRDIDALRRFCGS